MASSELVLQRYAKALHELASAAGTVERVSADLAALTASLAQQPGITRQLTSPRLTRQAKRALLLALLAPGGNDLVRRTILLLTDKGRAGAVPEFGAVFEAVAMQAAGRAVAHVTSAEALDAANRAALAQRLHALTGQQITLDETVDPELIAGLRVVVGSRMIDGSVKTRLERMREALLRVPLPAAD